MKKIIISFVVVIIFVITLFILKSRSGLNPETTGTPAAFSSPQVFEVLISENGLSKNNLAIKVGSTVKFINTDSALHWPASGAHPTHQICPGFDALRGLKQNETYSFTFNKMATCPFHDHINAAASYRGSITVTE